MIIWCPRCEAATGSIEAGGTVVLTEMQQVPQGGLSDYGRAYVLKFRCPVCRHELDLALPVAPPRFGG